MIGTHKTTITEENGFIVVIFHETPVIKWNHEKMIMNSGGWKTATTKKRINQASDQFNLGISVIQKRNQWFVEYAGKTIPFSDNMEIRK